MSPKVVSEARASTSRRFQPNVYWLICTAWLCCVGLPIVLEVQHRMGVQHFAPLPFCALCLTMMACIAVCFAAGSWRIVRGPQRRRGVILVSAALVPLAFWVAVGVFAGSSWSRRSKPNVFLMQVARRGAASVMGAELYWRYPRQVERPRFTMFHWGVATPSEDAGEMDAYLTDLEQRYHRSIRVPIYWVRGSLLGQSNLCDYGLALGSANSEAPVAIKGVTVHQLNATDRHEVAHAVMHQWQTPESDPPTFLEEGWAQANGNLQMSLASAAADLIRLEEVQQVPRRGTMLASLLSADSYYRDDGEVYPCGAYITIYLIEKYGFDKFLQLYKSIRPQTAATDIKRIFGTDLVTLEKQMWAEADRLNSASQDNQAAAHRTTPQSP